MSNTILTPTAVTREALRILHQNLNFVGKVNRQYDDSFAKSGAKIGDSLKIRLPNEYAVRTGPVMDVQDTSETSTTLQVSTQKGVDVNFTSTELTLSLDDFSSRVLEPAMSVLAANIEADVMNVYKDVYNEVSDVGSAISSSGSLANVLLGSKKLTDNLTPSTARCLNLNTQDNADMVNSLTTLYNPSGNISGQFRNGRVGNNIASYGDVYENTMWPIHTTGTDDGTGDYLTDIAASEADGSSGLLHIDTGAGTFLQGDIFFIEDCFRVHPETKVSTGKLQQFTVTADFAGGEGDLAISPSIVLTGARQNCVGLVDGKQILKVESDQTTAIGASADYGISLGFHKDAFTFATADLLMPKGVHFAAREVMDGISMRIVQNYDINNDKMPCRIDVLYGYKTIRPQLATRYGFN